MRQNLLAPQGKTRALPLGVLECQVGPARDEHDRDRRWSEADA